MNRNHGEDEDDNDNNMNDDNNDDNHNNIPMEVNNNEVAAAAGVQEEEEENERHNQPGGGGGGGGEHDGDDDDDDSIDRDENGVMDGGVAGSTFAENARPNKRRAADCDLVLYIECAEDFTTEYRTNPILKKSTVVSIGLDKSTKLKAVFERYADFCTTHGVSKQEMVRSEKLEFFHCQLLHPNDTAEASALMKNDRISVRMERSQERETQAELRRLERESDREYFKQMRSLCPDWGGGGTKSGDLILDCQGTIADGSGRNQQVLSTKVRGHSVILEKRCSWLGSMIQSAREEHDMKRAMLKSLLEGEDARQNDNNNNKKSSGPSDTTTNTNPDNTHDTNDEDNETTPQSDDSAGGLPEGNIVASSTLHEDNDNEETADEPAGPTVRIQRRMDVDDEDEEDIGVLPFPVPRENQPRHVSEVRRSGATEIVEDGEDSDNESTQGGDGSAFGAKSQRKTRFAALKASNVGYDPMHARGTFTKMDGNSDQLTVIIPNHPPDAVKLLLEYCYTNRVLCLGQEAFVAACKTKPTKPNGPVPPFSSSRRWPNGGLPQVSFSVALAGIAIAEEARLPRMSLMCEVAAAQLVCCSGTNVTQALAMCTQQQQATGNFLARLREVAIHVILREGPRSVFDTSVFRKAIGERSTSIIPTLIAGTAEVVEKDKNKAKTQTSRLNLRNRLLAGRKRDFGAMTEAYLNELDREDARKRERERRMRRKERTNPELASRTGKPDSEEEEDNDIYCDQVLSNSWAAQSAKRALSRMAPHLETGSLPAASQKSSRPGKFAGRPGSGYGMARKRSSRRNSSCRK